MDLKTNFRIRILALLFCLLAIGNLLTGCSGGTKASKKAVSVAKQAVEVADEYLDGGLTYSEAIDKLDALESDMAYVDDLDAGDEHKTADWSISVSIVLLSSNILFDHMDSTSESYDKVLDERNSLAEKAGLKKR